MWNVWAWETEALSLTLHTEARSTLIRHMLNLFSVSVGDSVNGHTDTFLNVDTMLSVIGHNMLVITGTTFNTGVWTVLDNLVPRVEVITTLWT